MHWLGRSLQARFVCFGASPSMGDDLRATDVKFSTMKGTS
jgi:hypothetical protein